VLFVVAHQIIECESVVAGNEVDTIDGLMTAGLIDVSAARQARGNGADQAWIPFDKTADVIAITTVPLGRVSRKQSDSSMLHTTGG
jgi:hypothetical protein